VCGSLGGAHTGLTVAAGFIGEGELSEVAADHIELDFDVVEGLSVVDGDVVADHFGEDDGVAEVGLDGGGFFAELGVLLALLALGVEADVSVLDLCMGEELLRLNLRRCLALNSSTTCSWVSSLIWSGVKPLKLCLFSPFSFFCTVAICG
jgi:hypothetical protein